MKIFSYGKTEKLKNKKDISLLFEKGKWQTVDHIRIIFLRREDFASNRIGVSVSKRNFKKATDRNRGKRLLREVYRLNKDKFAEAFGANCFAMLFWIGKELPKNYAETELNFHKLLQQQIKKQKGD